jgi:hypothetical protein
MLECCERRRCDLAADGGQAESEVLAKPKLFPQGQLPLTRITHRVEDRRMRSTWSPFRLCFLDLVSRKDAQPATESPLLATVLERRHAFHKGL